MRSPLWLALLASALAWTGVLGPAGPGWAPGGEGAGVPAPVVGFNRDVRPILADNCFACHGPDKNKRKAGLRLDTEEGALADRGESRPLVPGKLRESALYRRTTADDDEQ